MLISILVLPLSVLPRGRTQYYARMQQCDNVTKLKNRHSAVRNDDKRAQGNSLSVWSFPPRRRSARLHLLTLNCSEINTFSRCTEAKIW